VRGGGAGEGNLRLPRSASDTVPVRFAVLPCLVLVAGCAATAPPEAAAPDPDEPPAPRRARIAELPRHEVLGSTASPDGTSWYVLDVRLEERVPGASLRALWDSLRKEYPPQWRRFTCRFYLPDMSDLGDSWADVNELTIIESPPPPRTPPGEEPDICGVVSADGESYCIISFRGQSIVLPASIDTVSMRGSGADLEVEYWDPRERELKSIRLADVLREAPPPPRCLGAWLR